MGSAGNGGTLHLALEMLMKVAKVKMTHVPYKGAAPAVVDVVGGQVSGMFVDLPVISPYVKAGRVKALAMATPKRASLLPDLPTMTEQGLASVEAVNWYGVLVPAATPRDIIVKLNESFKKALSDTALREKLVARGAEPVGSAPEQFAAYLKEDIARWARLAQSTSIKVD